MLQWDIWLVKQQYARQSLNPPQPNDPSNYNRMYLIVADPSGRKTVICCPIQNSSGGIGLTEVPLQRGYTHCITKDSKVVCHDIFTLPARFFEKKVGFIRPSEQNMIQTALIMVFDLN
jgi:mRNA-degrading endonuclease toxin of MazEF toxin-antitoxin module